MGNILVIKNSAPWLNYILAFWIWHSDLAREQNSCREKCYRAIGYQCLTLKTVQQEQPQQQPQQQKLYLTNRMTSYLLKLVHFLICEKPFKQDFTGLIF